MAVLVAITISTPTLVLTPGERQTLAPDKDLPRGAEFRLPREPETHEVVFTDLGYPVDFDPVHGWHFRGDDGRSAGTQVPFERWRGEVVCGTAQDNPCQGFGIIRSLESWRTAVGPRADGTYGPEAPDFALYSALVISLRTSADACCRVIVASADRVGETLVVQADFELWPTCPAQKEYTEVAAVALLPKDALADAWSVEVRVHDFEVICP